MKMQRLCWGIKSYNYFNCFLFALALNLLKNILERSKTPFCPSFRFTLNRGPHRKKLKMGIKLFRASAENNIQNGVSFMIVAIIFFIIILPPQFLTHHY